MQADVAQWTGAISGYWIDRKNWTALSSAESDVMVTDLLSSLNNTVTNSNSGKAIASGASGTEFKSEGILTPMTLNQHSDSLKAGTLTMGDKVTVAEYTGSFTNNGAYQNDLSTNVFNGLTVGTNGYLIGSSGDVFKMQGDFYNNSISGLWATSAVMLEFTASSPTTYKMTVMDTAFG